MVIVCTAQHLRICVIGDVTDAVNLRSDMAYAQADIRKHRVPSSSLHDTVAKAYMAAMNMTFDDMLGGRWAERSVARSAD